MSKQDHKIGASKSLQKTISEIGNFIESDIERQPDEKLREFLHKKIAELSAYWFERGFLRGCIECEKAFDQIGSFPKKVAYAKSREVFTDQEQIIDVQWKAKSTRAAKVKKKIATPKTSPTAKSRNRQCAPFLLS